jgi:hypothetical protein
VYAPAWNKGETVVADQSPKSLYWSDLRIGNSGALEDYA